MPFIERSIIDEFWPAPQALFFQRYPACTMLVDRDDQILRVTANHDGERCLPVSLDYMSPYVLQALVAAEDQRFWQHSGVDLLALSRALVVNLVTGRRCSGASTLTMQLCRLIEPAPRHYWSKLKECFRARQWERIYTKPEIVEQYLNYAPFGGTLRGIEAASYYWYGKSSAHLDLLEAVNLIAMLPAPSRRRPDNSQHASFVRNILMRMLDQQFITDDIFMAASAQAETVQATEQKAVGWPFLAPHCCDYLLNSETTLAQIRNGREGVYYTTYKSTLMSAVQERCRHIINSAAQDLDGVALVLYGPEGVEALIGSSDYKRSAFNAACAGHDAGSTLKPFIYGQALELGLIHPNTLLQDQRVQIAAYRPENFDLDFKAGLRVADALSQSRNIPAITLLNQLGVERFSQQLADLRLIDPHQDLYCDAALGTNAVSPLALAAAYYHYFCEGERPGREEVLSYLSLRSPDQAVLGSKRVYWKTGTSSGRRDAWSVIWSEQRVLVLWMGRLHDAASVNCYGSGDCTSLAAVLAAELL